MLGRVHDPRPEPDVAQCVRRDARDDAARCEVRNDLAAGRDRRPRSRRAPPRGRATAASAAGHRALRRARAFSRVARPRIRASTRSRPIAWCSANASGSAQRCSKEWKPPGVRRRPVGDAASRAARDPRAVARAVEGRDRRPHELARTLVCPQHAGSARAVEPLVATGDEGVAREVPDSRGVRAEAVDAVDADEHTVRERLRDRPHREPDAGARMDPRQCDHPRPPRDRSADAAHDLVLRGSSRVAVERDPPHARAREPERLVRRVEVVLRGEHLVLRAESEARVEEAEAHGRRVRQGHFGRRRSQEATRSVPCRAAQNVTGAVQVLDGVRVEPCRCPAIASRTGRG